MNVYINDITAFLPHSPVNNDEIEDVLGRINDIPSRTKRIMLRNNKIETRHYAIDRTTGKLTHTNAQLAAEAVRKLNPYQNFSIDDIECLSCGTTTPDLLFPGHALMVLGELGLPPCDAVTTSGICICGMTALKYAFMNVATGSTKNAVAVGSDLASSYSRAKFFAADIAPSDDLEEKPVRAFDAEFLRWMLSDGAGAVFLSGEKNQDCISLKIDWIENISYAGQLETCMYAGGVKNEDGTMTGWRETESIDPVAEPYKFLIKQDTKLLAQEIVKTAMDKALASVVKKRKIKPEQIDWFLPHYSSGYFRDKFYNGMKNINFEIPYERWFTNLTQKGNTGSASIYIIMEELFHSGKLKKGQKLLCFIPESGRFSHCYMMLTAI
ncbi:MAG: beta-ketoacyl-ACP synthase III [Thermodesulfobacteriota bacterium]|nr:beta-ketoacyl-ACP synthase III [Thermodesulfobacteriota bacterium]